ncbi:MAG TPA: restriction endonuclease subunit R [Cytophagales bacterium]|nr:restriction endonuclease subunit R [Cytophagales bacterium]HAA21174.1 restriction endonuclease subunit R [Cytophagales bacterium]HAP60694.1 restriction endonuclease subunit R [Cytophagales bacterium]
MQLLEEKFPQLAFPPVEVRLREDGDQIKIFDPARKKWLVLTPEEWVRQHALHFLTSTLDYPSALVRTEGGQKVNGMARRFDVLVYNREGAPHLLMECKAPTVKITQDTFEQISAYNLTQRASILVVTNGLQHYCCRVHFTEKRYEWLSEIPRFG